MTNEEQVQIGVFGICYKLEYLIVEHADSFYEELSKNEKLKALIMEEMDNELIEVDPVWSFTDVCYFVKKYTFDIAREIFLSNLKNVFIDLYNCVLLKDNYSWVYND